MDVSVHCTYGLHISLCGSSRCWKCCVVSYTSLHPDRWLKSAFSLSSSDLLRYSVSVDTTKILLPLFKQPSWHDVFFYYYYLRGALDELDQGPNPWWNYHSVIARCRNLGCLLCSLYDWLEVINGASFATLFINGDLEEGTGTLSIISSKHSSATPAQSPVPCGFG